MMRISHPFGWIFSLYAVGLTSNQVALAQESPDKTVAGLHVPSDWQIDLYASEPMIENPTAIDVDSQGRVWVCEGQYYRGKAKTPPADCVKVLEDTDGDGKADKATVFADGLLVPMSVAVAGTRVYVGESPNLWVYEDKDGDLKADPDSKKALLTGFGGYNHDHGLHGLLLGPDHWLYMTHGDPGFDVTGPDGAHVSFKWGALLRCRLDGTGLERIAYNFRNPYELTLDSFGNIWCSDNDNDGLKSVRICWILEGGNYGWYGTPLDVRGANGSYDPMNHWRVPIPGHVPPALLTGFGSPAGIACYESDLFGASYQNTLLHTDAGPREVRVYRRETSGAGFVAKQETVVTAADSYFRPVDVCVGPDGSIYVADWYDEGVGGHAYNNPSQGRIYRIRPKGVAFQRSDKPGPYTNHNDAMDALSSPNVATQFLARQRLISEGPKAVRSLSKLVRGAAPNIGARALWVLDQLGAAEPIDAALKDPRPEFRALAVRILRRHQPVPLDRILPLASDPDVQVRREVLLALKTPMNTGGEEGVPGVAGKRGHGKSISTPTEPVAQARVSSVEQPKVGGAPAPVEPALLALIRAWDGQDRFYLEAIGVAVGNRRDEIFKALNLESVKPFDIRTIKLIQILQPSRAPALLVYHLLERGLPPEVAVALVDALGWATSPAAMTTVARAIALDALPMDARKLAIERIASRLHSDYRGLAASSVLSDSLKTALTVPELRITALSLAARTKNAALDQAVLNVLNHADSAMLRTAAIAALGQIGTPPAREALAKIAAVPSEDLQKQAIQALAQMHAFAELERLLTGAALSDELQRMAVEEISQSTGGPLMLLGLIDAKKLSQDRRREAIRLGLHHPDINVRQLYSRFAAAESQPATIVRLDPKRILELKGDAQHGHILFTRGEAKCTICHRVGSEGKDIGPELTLIGRKYGPEAMLEQILRPAAAVAPEFEPYVLDSESHGFLVGFVLKKTDREVEFKAVDGQRITVPMRDVHSLEKQPGTIMPDLLLETFKEQGVADLLAFLCSLKRVPQPITDWLVIGPFPNANHAGYEMAYDPEKKLDLKARYPLPGDGFASWKSVKAELVKDDYALELDSLSSAGKAPAVEYLYASIESPGAQEGQLVLRSSAAIKLFINDESRYERHTHPFRPTAIRVPIQLKAGRNILLLKVEHAGGPGQLSVVLETGEPVRLAAALSN